MGGGFGVVFFFEEGERRLGESVGGWVFAFVWMLAVLLGLSRGGAWIKGRGSDGKFKA